MSSFFPENPNKKRGDGNEMAEAQKVSLLREGRPFRKATEGKVDVQRKEKLRYTKKKSVYKYAPMEKRFDLINDICLNGSIVRNSTFSNFESYVELTTCLFV